MRNSERERYLETFLSVVARDVHRKSLARMALEYGLACVKTRSAAPEYFTKFCYRQGARDISNYLVTSRVEARCSGLNDPNYKNVLADKELFARFFRQANLPVVRTLATNRKAFFMLNDTTVQVGSAEEFARFLTKLLREEAAEQSIFIKKREGSSGGAHVHRVSAADCHPNDPGFQAIYRAVVASDYLFDDMIVQHARMNELNPHCVNTVRVDAYTNRSRSTRVIAAFVRVGTSKACVDNISSGGCYVGVDIRDGTLRSEAFSSLSHGGGESFFRHRENGMVFAGFKIPFFQECMDLAVAAAQKVPRLRVIGWDIGIQPTGPVLVEGNGRPGLEYSELAQGGFRDNPVFLELYEELGGALCGRRVKSGANGGRE